MDCILDSKDIAILPHSDTGDDVNDKDFAGESTVADKDEHEHDSHPTNISADDGYIFLGGSKRDYSDINQSDDGEDDEPQDDKPRSIANTLHAKNTSVKMSIPGNSNQLAVGTQKNTNTNSKKLQVQK
jgi:hypothetical protein